MHSNYLTALIGPLGTPELLIIVVIIIFLFGAKKIPQLAKGLASSLTEFRKGKNESSNERDQIEKHRD